VVWLHDYNLWNVPAFLAAIASCLTLPFSITLFPLRRGVQRYCPGRQIIGSLRSAIMWLPYFPGQVRELVDVVRGVPPVEVLETQGLARALSDLWLCFGRARLHDPHHGRPWRHIGLGAHPSGWMWAV